MIESRQANKTTGEIYSVTQLNRAVKGLIESQFPLIWIEGEISNLARPGSGHIYFSLKDSQSQVRCAMFRGKNSLLRFRPENGMQVLIFARVSLYEGRGEFQLIAERMEPSGEGALQLAFEQLKTRLGQEGLFDAERKRDLPEYPSRVGVVTSPSGAAIKDILSVLKRRFPLVEVIIYPTLVQGEGAAENIARMITLANTRAECDLLLVSRGGGSLEDLWSFNEECVARAIDASELPVVSGVGHEIDFTIADFVADVRAPTPSAAAELISPNQTELNQTFASYEAWFKEQMQRVIQHATQNVTWLEKRLVSPQQRVETLSQRADEITARLNNAMRSLLFQQKAALSDQTSRLRAMTPLNQIVFKRQTTTDLSRRLQRVVEAKLQGEQARFNHAARALNAVSPLATLERGYAIVQTQQKTLVRRADEVKIGDLVHTRLSDGTLLCEVKESVAQASNEIMEGKQNAVKPE